MSKLYYGNNTCTIESSSVILGVEIRFTGKIKIVDKTPDGFVINQQFNGIIIFPINAKDIGLNELFDYTGELKIDSVLVADKNAERVPTTIHRVMDYSELLKSKAEDMTVKSEDLSSSHKSTGFVAENSLAQPLITNLHTSTQVGSLYLEDGTVYSGDFHIHLKDSSAMTGAEHTKNSQDLYIMRNGTTLTPTKLTAKAATKNTPIRIFKHQKRRRGTAITRTTRGGTGRTGGTGGTGGGY